MKYLKLFEAQAASYEEIEEHLAFSQEVYGGEEEEDVADYALTHWEDITHIEAEQIFKLFRRCMESLQLKYFLTPPPHLYSRLENFPQSLQVYDRATENLGAQVFKLQDEWYYLRIVSARGPKKIRFYKCDQWAGLVECIQHCDLKFIYNV